MARSAPDERLSRWNAYVEKALGWDRFNEYQRRVRGYQEAGSMTAPDSGVKAHGYDLMPVSPESQSILPSFAAPPLDESVLAVQFEPNSVDSLHAATFYERVKADFPKREEQVARPPMGEDFAPVEPRPPFQIEVLRASPMPRFWFSSEDETYLIQLQHDFLAFNWRRRAEGSPYPRYESMRESVEKHLHELDEIVREDADRSLRPNWCEVTYINHVESGRDIDRPPLSALLAGVDIPREGGELPLLEDAQLMFRFLIPGDGGEPRGRLNVSTTAAIRNVDRVQIWAFTLTARLLADGARGIDGALEAFDVGHEWVAKAFLDLTSEQMRERWQTLEGD